MTIDNERIVLPTMEDRSSGATLWVGSRCPELPLQATNGSPRCGSSVMAL
ncbi:MAG: hypothetical protein KDD67_03905 [Ignavibacteriae bacterium]|nr:hypothetical protein [Ignavibacteriota bacterium]